ncbi:MAG: hypothetical protein LBT83_02520 [Tannerella sp.]|jgi:hypothetical protein|nr:hypothetical protein [Tannerella sp.]
MASQDWMKKSYEGLEEQVQNTITYVLVPANTDRMGLTGAVTWINTVFEPQIKAYTTAIAVWKDISKRTPLVIKTLQDEKAKLIPIYREMYTGFIQKNPLVTSTDREAMGLPPASDVKPTPSPDPTSYVTSEVKLIGPGVIEIHYRDQESMSRAKPFGVHGAEILWEVADEPTESWDDLSHSTFSTASPLRMTFQSNQRGKSLCFAARWENTRGVKGPLNEVTLAIIP